MPSTDTMERNIAPTWAGVAGEKRAPPGSNPVPHSLRVLTQRFERGWLSILILDLLAVPVPGPRFAGTSKRRIHDTELDLGIARNDGHLNLEQSAKGSGGIERSAFAVSAGCSYRLA